MNAAGRAAVWTSERSIGSSDDAKLRRGFYLALALCTGFALAYFLDAQPDGKILPALGVTTVLASLHAAALHPQRLPLLLAAYLPFNICYPFLSGIPGMNMTNFLLNMCLLGILNRRLRGQAGVPFAAFEWVLVVFAGLGFLASLNGAFISQRQDDLGVSLAVQFLVVLFVYKSWVTPILLFFIARGLIEDRRQIQYVLLIILFSAVLAGGLTWKDGLQSTRSSIEDSRVGGILRQPNTMGAFLAYYSLPALGLFLRHPTRPRAAIYLGGFLLAMRGLMFTFSRGAYFSVLGGAALMLLLRGPHFFLSAAGGGALISLAYPSLLPSSVAERLGHTAASDDIYGSGVSEDNLDQSARYRLILWRAGFGMMQDYPLLGVGLQRFARVVEAYTEIPLGPNDPRDAHNAYILMAAELGIPMFLLMATLLLTLLGTAVYVYLKRQDPVDRTLGLSMAGTVVAVIVSCMFGSRFSDEGLIGYFWLMSALLISVRRMPVESQGKETTA